MTVLCRVNRWLNLNGRQQPTALELVGFQDDANPNAAAGFEDVVAAYVIPTPEVRPSEQVIYQTASSFLVINGTNFGNKGFKPYFDPPLLLDIDYTVYDVTPTQATLALRPGAKWREDPGPLYVRGLDTGGGIVKIGDDRGARVARVQADLAGHSVTVDSNEELKIYQTAAQLVITGEGFSSDPEGNDLRFANGILGGGRNFTVYRASPSSLTLKLSPGSLWRLNGENLPGPLTLLAVDAGDGFVAVGATNARKGRNVATVYETPSVYPNTVQLSQTHSHELNIFGIGFPVRSPRDVELEFDRPLTAGVDYELKVLSRSQLQLQLLDGKSWGPIGKLMLKFITTIGPEGRIPLNGAVGVQVAEIIADDNDAVDNTGISIQQVQQKIYQSKLQRSLIVRGAGFKKGISLVFRPALQQGVDYDMTVESETSLRLNLKPGKKWASEAGPLTVMAVKVEGTEHQLARGNGIRVATVLADPSVDADESPLHVSQSKALWLRGTGFTDLDSTRVKLTPTPEDSFRIVMVLPDAARLLLNEGQDWYPDFEQAGAEKVPLKLTAIDTGAGMVELNPPVVVGTVIQDREGVECDDSCEFAFDGICDDSSAVKEPDWGWDGDDDYGGYEGFEYNYMYDDYLMDDEYSIPACFPGTDCTDCGGVDAIEEVSVICENTCTFPRDGVCDDPRGGAYCPLGTDCQDCGPVGAPNFTLADENTFFDDDDDVWAGQELPDNFFEQA